MAEQPSQNGKSTDESKRKPIAKESKSERQPKKIMQKGKRVVQEIIDLEQDQNEQKELNHSQNFVYELAKKCNLFFGWIANTNSPVLAEQLWKNQMLTYAGQLYPELNNDQLQRIVDRDWRYMSEEERQKIVNQYSNSPNQQVLQQQIDQYEINRQLSA